MFFSPGGFAVILMEGCRFHHVHFRWKIYRRHGACTPRLRTRAYRRSQFASATMTCFAGETSGQTDAARRTDVERLAFGDVPCKYSQERCYRSFIHRDRRFAGLQ